MNPHIKNMFGGVQHVPGLGFVQSSGGAARSGLGDDGSVMMISGVNGLGNTVPTPEEIQSTIDSMRKRGKSEEEIAQAVKSMQNVQPYGPPTGSTVPTYVGPQNTNPIPLTQRAPSNLTQQVTLFNVTLPLWTWLLIAAALGGAVGRLTK